MEATVHTFTSEASTQTSEIPDLDQYLPTYRCLLYTSDAADERSSVDLGGRRIIKKKKQTENRSSSVTKKTKKYMR